MTSSRSFNRGSVFVVATLVGALGAFPELASAAAVRPATSDASRPRGASRAPGETGAHGRRKKTRARTKPDSARVARAHHAPGGRARGKVARAGKSTKVVKVAAIIAPSPGPRLTPEAVQALDQVTRNQIERAESAARRPELTRRWETVSFLLSGVDDRRYPAAGFWRALAAYRRGDLAGGDAVRGECTLAERDGTALDEERAVAATLAARARRDARAGDDVEGAPPETAGFVRATFVESPARPVEGVHNDAPYAGPAPTSGGRLAAN